MRLYLSKIANKFEFMFSLHSPSIIRFFFIIFSLSACKISPYFSTSNDFYKQEVTLDMINGNQLTGETSVLFEETTRAPDYIEFKSKNDTAIQKISIKSIKGYRYKGNYYAVKYVDLFFSGTYNLLFLKRLTKENSKIQFYELHQVRKTNDTGEEQRFYFISLRTHSLFEVWNIYSKNLVPNFEVKMSTIVSDCPGLAAKIKAKTKGYFLAQYNFSDSKKIEVFERIIEEYNNCK